MPETKTGDEWVMMKITGVLVNMLVKLNPELYGPYVALPEDKESTLVGTMYWEPSTECCRGSPILLWYKKFQTELEAEGFKFNPYDPCVANCWRKGSQHMLLFHVDDLKSSHKHSWESTTNLKHGYRRTVDNYMDKWSNSVHGKIHKYLSMEIE